MPFILPPNAVFNFSSIRAQYQDKKQVNFSEPQSMLGRPIFFGGTDVKARKEQITFLEKIYFILKPNLFKEEDITSIREFEANLTASRVMIAVALYSMSQMSSSKRRSVLYALIEDNIGITASNALDRQDQELCILTAKRLFTTSSTSFEDANTALRNGGMSPFTESEWDNFTTFLRIKNPNALMEAAQNNYPITCVTQKFFGMTFGYTGATIGMLCGDAVSRSTKALSTKTQLTAFVGGTLYVFGSAGPAGVALFAPAIAERLICTFCTLSLAHLLGRSMQVLGQGVGIGIGMPLDLTYQLLLKFCNAIGSYSASSPQGFMTGTRIIDGVTVVKGIAINPTAMALIPEDCVQKIVTVRDGNLYVDDTLIETPTTQSQLSPAIIEEINEKLNPDDDAEDIELTPLLDTTH